MNRIKGKSLEEVHESVSVMQNGSTWRKILAFFGPAYMVSVGYMDPGNWATDIAGGSQYGYRLIWVLLMSNIMALLLQSLSARLGIVKGRDLAQASRETYPSFINFILYILAEIAIVAMDLAEVLGMAIGLNLLFNIPMVYGVIITALDTFLLLFLINKGIRKMEAFIIALIVVIGLSFLAEMIFSQPNIAEILKGFLPALPDKNPKFPDGNTSLYIAIGIIGATVMPHNLYLHSSLVQTRKINRTFKGIKQALKYNFFDSLIALNLAFFVNAAILVLAAATFYKIGKYNVEEIQDAYKWLEPLLGTQLAPMLFAVALIAAGQSSTITGTLAGQIVMEGHLNIRIQPWIRRIITRLLAIVPALFTIVYFGMGATGELLVFSQVVLSLQLGFAIVPLIHFVSSKKKMGKFVINLPTKFISWVVALVIIALNVKLVFDEIVDSLKNSEYSIYIWAFAIPIAIGAFILLLYTIFEPVLSSKKRVVKLVPHTDKIQFEDDLAPMRYHHIALTLDFSGVDQIGISRALQLGRKEAKYTLIHVVETAGALVLGREIGDYETESDISHLKKYQQILEAKGYKVTTEIGFGNPKKEIAAIINKNNFDILIMGVHGHSGIKDLIFGTTVDSVRHRVRIPVMIVQN